MLIGSRTGPCIEAHCKKLTYPCNIYQFITVFLSYVLDWRTFVQIRYNYINRRIAIASWLLDLFIFVGGLWCIAIAVQGYGQGEGKAIQIVWIIVTILAFFRVPNIVYLIFYFFCCSWIFCLPDWCCCKEWLSTDAVDPAVLDLLKMNEWVYSSEAMTHTEQRAKCLICLNEITDG